MEWFVDSVVLLGIVQRLTSIHELLLFADPTVLGTHTTPPVNYWSLSGVAGKY